MNTSTAVEPKPATLAAPATVHDLLAVVADPVRWRLLAALADGSRCVCRLRPAAAVSAPALSHHLRVLREAGLITAHRRGRWIDYALSPTAAARLYAALPVAPGAGGHDTPAQRTATRGGDDRDDPAA